jgi:hypothetical protein
MLYIFYLGMPCMDNTFLSCNGCLIEHKRRLDGSHPRGRVSYGQWKRRTNHTDAPERSFAWLAFVRIPETNRLNSLYISKHLLSLGCCSCSRRCTVHGQCSLLIYLYKRATPLVYGMPYYEVVGGFRLITDAKRSKYIY